MSPSREEDARDSNRSPSATVPTPVASHTSHFTAVNGSSKPVEQGSTNRLASPKSSPQLSNRIHTAQQENPRNKQDQSMGIPTPEGTLAYSRVSVSRSDSRSAGEGDDGSDLSSSVMHSPTTPTSLTHDGQTKQGQFERPETYSRSNKAQSEDVTDTSTSAKRKRSSLSPNPHPPHPRTDAYGSHEMDVEEAAAGEKSSINAQLIAAAAEGAGQKDAQVAAEAREQLSQYNRSQLRNDSSTMSRLDRGESMDGQSQSSDMMMMDSQPSQMSQRGPSQQLSQEHGYDPSTPMQNGIRTTDNKRKRVFSNRTKTGCITCRRRKKKCDEEKPECANCKRGGFVCEGYTSKVPWQKPSGKSPSIQTKQESSTLSNGSPANIPMSVPAQEHVIHQHILPQQPGPSFAVTQSPATIRVIERQAPQPIPPMEYAMTHIHSHPHQTHNHGPPGSQSTGNVEQKFHKQPISDPRSHGATGMPLSGAQVISAPVRRPFHDARHDRNNSIEARSSLLQQQPPSQGQSYPSNHSQRSAPTRYAASEKEKMLNGDYFHAFTPELLEERDRCKAACWRFNNAANPTLGIGREEKLRFLMEILRPMSGVRGPQPGWNGEYGANGHPFSRKALPGSENTGIGGYPAGEEPWIEAPFICDYGYNIKLGQGVFINFGCTIIDTCTVTIKARTIIGPNVQIYAGGHPLNPRTRNGTKGPEFGKPVTIEEDCWIGGNVTILPGVKVGTGATIGAGSVVTKDVPPNTVVAGNPAKVVKGILEHE